MDGRERELDGWAGPGCDRRRFLAGLGGAGFLAGAGGLHGAPDGGRRKLKFCAFAKALQSYSFGEAADIVAELGFDGIEATVRKGGQVEPAEVGTRLPELVEALGARGLEVTVMATDIDDAADPVNRRVLEVAADLGVTRYRLSYFKYDLGKPVAAQLDPFRARASVLAELNGKLGLQGLYQNHAGKDYVGAAVWDLDRLLDGTDPDQLGVAYDLRHARVEGGLSWPAGYNLIRPRVRTFYAKDFRWEGGQKVANVPLGEGLIDPAFYEKLDPDARALPISVHVEYLDHGQESDRATVTAAFGKDLATLRLWTG